MEFLSGLKKLFAGKDKPSNAEVEAASDAAKATWYPKIAALGIPTVALTCSDDVSNTYFGGLPKLPSGLSWPANKSKPLIFLAQIDLSELPPGFDASGLPASGTLFFFYDEDQPWGFDPADRTGWSVLYTSEETKSLPDFQGNPPLEIDQSYIEMTATTTSPSLDHGLVEALEIPAEELDCLDDFYEDQPSDHLLGYPDPVQDDDMDLQCQLTSNGVYTGSGDYYHSVEGKALAPGRHDWILLAQFFEIDENFPFGDLGKLYFWIRKQDLDAGDFSKVWAILQCH